MLYHILYPLHTYLSAFNVFKYITFRTIYATLTALVICLLLGPWFIRLLQRLRLKERINGYTPKTHLGKTGTPTMGGILIVSAIAVATLLWADLFNLYVWLCMFILITYAVLGFIDDYLKTIKGSMVGVPAKIRLLVEFCAAAVVGYILVSLPGFDRNIVIPFFKNISLDLGVLYIPFVMMVIVGTANAVNLTDGLDGL
ncbi:MAG TPA: phospho-N-acetylmuramoyl-pentapeptide-transferase, partial [Deltaproteobacteria bacterium]|nr:phospho-N-acetylmuramoyl-pentapeptide-transferase [Deltaproteobacteria bacterium]